MSRQDERERSWKHVFGLMQSAWTRAEIEGAEAAMRAHLAAYPEERDRDPWHGWHYKIGGLEEREAESRRLGLSKEEHAQRQEMLRRTFVSVNPVDDPDALVVIARAKEEIEAWLARHPTDVHALARLERANQEERVTQQVQALMREEELKTAA